MPEREVIRRARRQARAGKSPSTQAGEFVREEVHHIREGKHGARSTKQAIAIGLSKARRAGVDLPPPAEGRTSAATRRSAERAHAQGQGEAPLRGPSTRRSRAARAVLRREGRRAASPDALSRQARAAAARRGPRERSRAAKKAAVTKAARGRAQTARKAARPRRARADAA